MFISKHLTSVALNLGGMGGAKGKWGGTRLKFSLTGCSSYFSNVSFFLNCLAVTRSTKLEHEQILMGMRELKQPSNESSVSFMIYC